MLKKAILENVIGEYMFKVEKKQQFEEISYKLDKQVKEIYEKYGLDFGEKLEGNIWCLIGLMGENMYIRGLKDGIKL